jgi:two-component system nitrate/nitrite response regulator NarL
MHYIRVKLASVHHFCYNLAVPGSRSLPMRIKSEMPIKVLLADDSEIMREAIKKLLAEEPRIKIVGEAGSFASAMQLVADHKPDILLLDLHMPQKRELQDALVKSQLHCIKHTLAISFANDEEARSLAASYGCAGLLDKMSLYSELLPAIMRLVTPGSNQSYQVNMQTGREGLGFDSSE